MLNQMRDTFVLSIANIQYQFNYLPASKIIAQFLKKAKEIHFVKSRMLFYAKEYSNASVTLQRFFRGSIMRIRFANMIADKKKRRFVY